MEKLGKLGKLSKLSSSAARLLTAMIVGAVLTFGLFGLSACGGAAANISNIQDSDLVGVWKEVDIDNYYYFESDGTGRETYESDTFQLSSWRVENNHLYLDFVGGVEDYDIEMTGDGKTLTVKNPLVDYTYKKQ